MFGRQDEYNPADFVNSYPRAGDLIERCELQISNYVKNSLITIAPRGKTYGAANLQLSGDWISATLYVGKQRFDKIHKRLGHTNFWYIEQNRTFPSLKHHDVEIEVETGDGGASVIWDKVNVENYASDKSCDIFALAHQVNGCYSDRSYVIRRGESNIQLQFNHPVYAIYVLSDKPISNLYIKFNSSNTLRDAAFKWNDSMEQWELILQEVPEDGVPTSAETTINFSRLDIARLYFEHDHDNVEIAVHAVCSQLTRIMNGMAGLAFTK